LASEARTVIFECAKLHGAKESSVKIIGHKEQESITSDVITAVRLTGNHPTLTLNYGKAGELSKIAGVCIFAAGNQASATINLVGVTLGSVVFVGRGNKPIVTVNVDATSELTKIFADLRGNNSVLSVAIDKGSKSECAGAYIHTKNKKGEFRCTK
jgi:hypothetical protein